MHPNTLLLVGFALGALTVGAVGYLRQPPPAPKQVSEETIAGPLGEVKMYTFDDGAVCLERNGAVKCFYGEGK